MPKTQKRVPWKGWSLLKPGSHQKTIMLQKCGKKCFLGCMFLGVGRIRNTEDLRLIS